MKHPILKSSLLVLSTFVLVACGGGGASSPGAILDTPAKEDVAETPSTAQVRSFDLRSAYQDLNLISLDQVGMSRVFQLTSSDPRAIGWKYLYTITNNGSSQGNVPSVILRKEIDLRDFNNVSRAASTTFERYDPQTGKLSAMTFENNPIAGIVTQSNALPESIPLDGEERSGLLHQVEFTGNNGILTGNWQWLGKTEGFYELLITERLESGGLSSSTISHTTSKYLFTSDGQISRFFVTISLPGQGVEDITFDGVQSTRILDINSGNEDEQALDIELR